MDKIRILSADDHAIVRMGLVTLLGAQDGFEVVGEEHVTAILAKVGAIYRTEAVAIALRKHLLKI